MPFFACIRTKFGSCFSLGARFIIATTLLMQHRQPKEQQHKIFFREGEGKEIAAGKSEKKFLGVGGNGSFDLGSWTDLTKKSLVDPYLFACFQRVPLRASVGIHIFAIFFASSLCEISLLRTRHDFVKNNDGNRKGGISKSLLDL